MYRVLAVFVLVLLSELKVWPNPNAGDGVSYRIEGLTGMDKTVTVRIIDALGRQIWVESVKYNYSGCIEGQLTFSNKLAKGLYTIEAIHSGETFYSKMVVE